MLIQVSELQAKDLIVECSGKDQTVYNFLGPLMESLLGEWLSVLKGAKLSLMLHIVRRTVMMGKRRERISVAELIYGYHGDKPICDACGYGNSVVRESLKSLVDDDFLIAYRTTLVGRDVEVDSKIFEVNFKKVIPSYRNLIGGLSESNTPLHDIYMSDVVTTKYVSGERASSFFSRAGFAVGGSHDQPGETSMFVGKRREGVGGAPSKSLTKVVEAIAEDAALKRARRAAAASASPGTIDKLGMQSLLDKHTTAVNLGYRVMATQREFGVLKRRIKENPPRDLNDFIRYCITYWSMIAQQNHNAIARNTERRAKSKPMPAAPNFTTLAYWYPYFLKCYNNFVAQGQNPDAYEPDEKAKRLAAQLAEANAANASLRKMVQLAKSVRRQPEPIQVSSPLIRRGPPRAVDIDAEMDFPEWDSSKAISNAKARGARNV